MKIAVMADVGRTLKEEIIPKEDSVIDMIRVATYIHQLPGAIELIEDAHAKGYETTCNIMAISKSFDDELSEVLETLSKTNVDVIYIANYYSLNFTMEDALMLPAYFSILQVS